MDALKECAVSHAAPVSPACRDPKPVQAPPAPFALPEDLARAQEEVDWL